MKILTLRSKQKAPNPLTRNTQRVSISYIRMNLGEKIHGNTAAHFTTSIDIIDIIKQICRRCKWSSLKLLKIFEQPNLKLITKCNKQNYIDTRVCVVDGFTINNNGPKLNEFTQIGFSLIEHHGDPI